MLTLGIDWTLVLFCDVPLETFKTVSLCDPLSYPPLDLELVQLLLKLGLGILEESLLYSLMRFLTGRFFN